MADEPWPKEARDAVKAIEDAYDIEVVSIEHHTAWVERAEGAEAIVKIAQDVVDDTTIDEDGYPNVGYDGSCALLRLIAALKREK